MIARRGLLLAVVAAVLASLLAACSGSSADATRPVTRAEITAMLRGHERAVATHHRAAFLAGVDDAPAARRFRREQAGEFANLTRLPLSHWSYALGPRGQDPAAQAAARHRFGPSAVIYRLTLAYALRGVDAQPTSHDLWWTFVRRDGRAVAADDRGFATIGGASWRGPWDFGPLRVVRGRFSLVLGPAADPGLLSSVAATVDKAVPVVTSVWGGDWRRTVAVLVPSGESELRADLGARAAGGEPIAALAVTDGSDPLTGAVLGQRLVVNPQQLRRLSHLGQRIVIQHEITHIADAAATGDSSPRWLVEGFADFVGNLDSGQPVPVVAGELRSEVRHGRLPRELPTGAAFDSPSTAAAAYEGAWLACRLIAARIGTHGLVAFYRAVGTSHADAQTATAAALRRLLHESLGTFTAQWRAYLHNQLG